MKKVWKHRYQIVEEKGKGGSGIVYKVWDIHLEKIWAMKILEVKWSEDLEWGTIENMTERKALKQISHPNFPRIVDAFEEEGKSILIMDYVQGITLEEVIKKGPMKEEEMTNVLIQLSDALVYLHQCNPVLLYLDLKPANIMIDENKTIKLIDLGSVSIKGRCGKISGSFGYASPEQVRVHSHGSLLKEQSDIFSFGMVLYAMVTGSNDRLPLVDARSRHGVFVRQENPFISGALERIIEKCTRGNENRRYSSMREVKKDIENWALSLTKRRIMLWSGIRRSRNSGKLWYQEKSIFCTEGKHSIYIAKKILLLCICIVCLLPGKVTYAGEKKMAVVIRDYKLRKVLLKENCIYETANSILLEIPWDEIEGEECKIRVECEDKSGIEKQFYIKCRYKE